MKAISSVIAAILLLMITIALASTAYMFTSGMLTGKIAKTIDILSSQGQLVVIQNLGTQTIAPSDLKIIVNGQEVEIVSSTSISPHSSTAIKFAPSQHTNCKDILDSGTSTVQIVSPSNAVTYTVDFSSSGDGVYYIKPAGTAAFQAYCDMATDGGGWTLVYKLSDGVAGDSNGIWTGTVLNEGDASLLDLIKDSSHYMNRIVPTYWNQNGFTVNEARVNLYTGGSLVKYLKYNGAGSSKNDWFAEARQTSASWTDITTEPNNYYSIPGGGCRDFFINRDYEGCPADDGWLVVSEGTCGCAWDSYGNPAINILYADASTYQNWESGWSNGNVKQADVFAVFVR